MADKIKFVARLTSEQTREVTWEIDAAEFAEWTDEEPTPARIKEFIESGRDRDEIEDAMWALGRDVDNTISGFTDIEKITLL